MDDAISRVSDAQTHVRAGEHFAEAGQLEAAAREFKTAVRLDTQHVSAHVQLAKALVGQCHSRRAGQLLLQAQLHCASPAVQHRGPPREVTTAFKDVVRLVEAIKHYRAALDVVPSHAAANTGLAQALSMQGRLDDAIKHFEASLRVDEGSYAARAGLADVLLAVGRVDESIDHMQQLLRLRPELDNLHGSLLLALHYRDTHTPAELFEEHRRYGERFTTSDSVPWRPEALDRHPDRRLRIGYLSPDLRAHSVAFFVEPLLEAHDRREFEVTCYSRTPVPDAVTTRLKAKADRWRDVHSLENRELVELIRTDEVDILVELSGHTLGSSLRALARRAAPVQVTYIGYPNTTGVLAIDYRLTDGWADPPGEADAMCTERLIRLEPGFLCYRPPAEVPDVGPLPSGTDGPITFGSFNNLSKLSPRVIACWAELLHVSPDARLVLKAGALGYSAAREYVRNQFVERGVAQERLVLLGQDDSPREHLDRYNVIDIALDTFPYNGTTTTCEAAWMGVPVITLAGNAHVSRVGVSLLSQLGLPELIANSPVEYVDLAADLARDRQRLAALRASLRQRMADSPLTDSGATTRSIEAAFRTMWHSWVFSDSQSAISG